MDLVKELVAQLGVDTAQASGGAGALMKLARDKLGDADFGKLSDAVPEMGDLLGAAPETGGGLGGMLGGLAGSLGGQAGQLGDLAGLASSFGKLGLDAGMVGKFVPIVLAYVQSQGGDGIKGLLEKVLA